jgi:hypothetical protein
LYNILVTKGYISSEALGMITPVLHAANSDLKGFSDDFYRRVARQYTAYLEASGAPTAGIAEAAEVPRSTAVRWVHQARKRGLLPPTTQGKARSDKTASPGDKHCLFHHSLCH